MGYHCRCLPWSDRQSSWLVSWLACQPQDGDRAQAWNLVGQRQQLVTTKSLLFQKFLQLPRTSVTEKATKQSENSKMIRWTQFDGWGTVTKLRHRDVGKARRLRTAETRTVLHVDRRRR